jgi:hypothetical protein
MKRPRGPIPTLGDLQRSSTKWVWLCCERCQHHAPFACAVAVIRWGPETSSEHHANTAVGSLFDRCLRPVQRPFPTVRSLTSTGMRAGSITTALEKPGGGPDPIRTTMVSLIFVRRACVGASPS